MIQRLFAVAITFAVSISLAARTSAEDRTIDGSGNNQFDLLRGAANTPFIRFGYTPQFIGPGGAMITDAQRANPRTISNAIFAQSSSRPSARNLSNFIWSWGQFLTHDTDLITTSAGPIVNGTAPIAVTAVGDILGPNPIPFTRENFVPISGRTPINEVTSYIDASQVYGSDIARATALRTGGGTGAKLLLGDNDLLPFNTVGLPNDNSGPLPNNQMFLAGDVRSNENTLLTALHTVFAREHNRLVDRIAAQQPGLSAEAQYQLARKLVGAEMQAITYREFIPALMGNSGPVPRDQLFSYSPGQIASITTAWSHAAFRFGHSAVTSELNLINNNGSADGSLSLRDVFFNPTVLTNNPSLIDDMLRGAAMQVSEEIDALMVDDMRNFLFGPPGAGGLDLAALNIQRARDSGLPHYRSIRSSYGAGVVPSFAGITSDPSLAQALAAVYANNLNNIDAWVGGLAEDHIPNTSVGPFFKAMLESQFARLRDGDRFFYRGVDAGLYTGNVLNADIAALVDLDHVTLADIIMANTSIEHLPRNVFFVPLAGDFNGDGSVDAADYSVWRDAWGTTNVFADGNGDGTVDDGDLAVWQANFGRVFQIGDGGPIGPGPRLPIVPEPASLFLIVVAALLLLNNARFAVNR